MTQDSCAKYLSLAAGAVIPLAYIGHFAPLACWLSAWAVLILTTKRETK